MENERYENEIKDSDKKEEIEKGNKQNKRRGNITAIAMVIWTWAWIAFLLIKGYRGDFAGSTMMVPGCLVICAAGVILLAVASKVLQSRADDRAPVMSEPARVLSRRVVRNNDSGPSYYVTFRLDNGADKTFGGRSGRGLYERTHEGDRGKLTFQGSRFLGFDDIKTASGTAVQQERPEKTGTVKQAAPAAYKARIHGRIIRRELAGEGETFLIDFLQDDGKIIRRTARVMMFREFSVGDHGILVCKGEKVQGFEKQGSLELTDCEAEIAEKVDLSNKGMFILIIRSDALKDYGGILRVRCSMEDFHRLRKGDRGLMTLHGTRLTAFLVPEDVQK